MPTPSRVTAFQESARAATVLRQELAAHGLTLPALKAEPPVDGRGFVELGGVPAHIAERLAEILRAAPRG